MISRYYPSTAPLYYTVALERYFDISIPLNAIDVNVKIFGKTACLNKFNNNSNTLYRGPSFSKKHWSRVHYYLI